MGSQSVGQGKVNLKIIRRSDPQEKESWNWMNKMKIIVVNDEMRLTNVVSLYDKNIYNKNVSFLPNFSHSRPPDFSEEHSTQPCLAKSIGPADRICLIILNVQLTHPTSMQIVNLTSFL